MIRSLIIALGIFAVGAIYPASASGLDVELVFSQHERQIIVDYYQHRTEAKHAGKKFKRAKRLPPGIAKNLARGKPMPPGIAKQYLPAGLIELLPPAPKGYERVMVGGKVLLVEIATQVIHDVLMDAVFD